MADHAIPLRRYPSGQLRDHPRLRTLAEAEADIAARVAAYRIGHLRPHAPSLDRPGAILLRPVPLGPTRIQPTIKPPLRRSWWARLFGRDA